ncbi:MAG: DNA polymerase Y family protein [Thermoleophilia bacterium]|nr:DNA polymerase Y family protein [Thermoleophilia bacterium]
MIACLTIDVFALRAALRARLELVGGPAALAPAAGERDLVGPCTEAARQAGVRPGMRLGEALAACPELALVERDPAAVAEEWERLLRRLEAAGLAVEPVQPGCAYFETAGVERLAGGLRSVLRRALDAAGPEWEPRIGAAARRFAALAAASVAPPGQALVVDDGDEALFLEPLPLDVLPLTPERRRELADLGVRRLGELARLPGAAVADRLGRDGEQAWRLAHGEDDRAVKPRRPAEELAESLAFPEAVANALTLEWGLAALLDRLLARPERAGRAPRQLALSARLAAGGSWRRAVTLREPTAEPRRLQAALAPKLAELPGPAVELRLVLSALAGSVGVQEELVRPEGRRLRELLREGLRQVRAAAGIDAVGTVVEVAPWSRIPEARAVLVPRDD